MKTKTIKTFFLIFFSCALIGCDTISTYDYKKFFKFTITSHPMWAYHKLNFCSDDKDFKIKQINAETFVRRSGSLTTAQQSQITVLLKEVEKHIE